MIKQLVSASILAGNLFFTPPLTNGEEIEEITTEKAKTYENAAEARKKAAEAQNTQAYKKITSADELLLTDLPYLAKQLKTADLYLTAAHSKTNSYREYKLSIINAELSIKVHPKMEGAKKDKLQTLINNCKKDSIYSLREAIEYYKISAECFSKGEEPGKEANAHELSAKCLERLANEQ